MINYKQNGLVFLARFILPCLAVLLSGTYYLAIRPTVLVYQQYSTQCVAGSGPSPLGVSAGYTTARAKQIQGIYGRFLIDTLSWKSQLWNAASGLSRKYDCKLTLYPAVQKETCADQLLLIQTLGFSGSYSSLLRLLDELEKRNSLGRVSALRLARKPRQSARSMEVDFSGIQKAKPIRL